MADALKQHRLTRDEKLWFREVLRTGSAFNVRLAKVKLFAKLSPDFLPERIDSRLYSQGRLTLAGTWLIDPKNEIFRTADVVISAIRKRIISNPGIEEFTASELEKETGIEQMKIGQALRSISELGAFFTQASGSPDGIGYSAFKLFGENSYDEYLRYQGLDPLLERYYTSRDSAGTWPNLVNTTVQLQGLAHSPFLPQVRQVDTVAAVTKRDTAFVLMPIDPANPALQDVYETIKSAFAAFDVNAYRADEIEHQDRITDRILSEIRSCEYLIADLSLERPNVYYEIGYGHALGKRPILIRSSKTRLHFDLSVHNVPEYKNMTELRQILDKRLSAIFGRDPAPMRKRKGKTSGS